MNDASLQSTRHLIGQSFPGNPLPPGLATLLPGYTLLECLGKGGMGAVYKAHQVGLDRLVAVKLLSPDLEADREYVTRFLQEARTAGKLRHLNIVSGLDCGVSKGVHFMVMEFVAGRSLDSILKERKQLPETEALGMAKQIAEGLQYAWGHRIIHRDIKPQNILITPEGIAKICDLGLSRNTRSDVHLTTTGFINCTPTHSSPEQARGDKDLDCRSDIYSLGITMYQMVTGQLPFRAEAPGALIIKHVTERPQPPLELNASLSPGANRLILKMLEKQREKRPETPGAVALAIDGLLRPPVEGDAPPRERTRRSPPPPGSAPGTRKRLLLSGATGLFVVLVAAWTLGRRTEAPVPARPLELPKFEAPPLAEKPEPRPVEKVLLKAGGEPKSATLEVPDIDSSARLSTFLSQIDTVISADLYLQRDAEIRSMWQSALKIAGSREAEVRRRMETYERQRDATIRRAVDDIRSATDAASEYQLTRKALMYVKDTPAEAELQKKLENLKPKVRAFFPEVLKELDARVAALVAKEKYGEAIGLVSTTSVKFSPIPEWSTAIHERFSRIQGESASIYQGLETAALDARRRGDEAEIKAIRKRIAGWSMKTHAAALEKALNEKP